MNFRACPQVEGAPARTGPGQPEILHVHSESPQQDAMPPLVRRQSTGAQLEYSVWAHTGGTGRRCAGLVAILQA